MPFSNQILGPFRGLNEDENPHALDKNDLIEARNVYRRGNTWGTRPGTIREATGQQYANTLTAPAAVQGLHEYRKNIDEGRVLIAVGKDPGSSASLMYYEDAATMTAGPVMTAGQNNIWTFANHNNKMYAAGGLAGTDDFFHWDGTTPTAGAAIAVVDSAAARIRPQYVYAWRGYLFINGLVGGVLPDNNPSTTRFADFGTDYTDITNWKHGNTIGFRAFGESYTTGMSGFRDNNGDFLLVLYNDGIGAVTLDTTTGFNVPFQVNDAIANGCVHQRAFVSLGLDAGDAVYMSQRGIHSMRQSQQHGNRADQFLSWKIRNFFETLGENRKKYSIGAYNHVDGYVLFAVSTAANPAHDKILCLDVKGNEPLTAENAVWSIWDLNGKNINELKMLRDQDDVWRMYFGTTVGDVGYFSNDTFNDVGVLGISPSALAYTVRMQTPHQSYGSIMERKTLGDVMITLEPGGAYKPTMRFHFDYGARTSQKKLLTMADPTGSYFGTSAGAGSFGSGVFGGGDTLRDEKVYGTGSGRTISFSIEHAVANEPFWIGRIDHQVDQAGEDAGSAS